MVIVTNNIASTKLLNTIDNSIMFGSNSNIPTLFIGTSAGDNTTGKVGIATTTPQWSLDIASTTMPQLALSGNVTDNHWTFRSIGNKLSIATASPTTFATTSIDALTINNSGQILGQAGTVSLPTFSFASSPSSGLYLDPTLSNVIDISVGGVKAMDIKNDNVSDQYIVGRFPYSASTGGASAPGITFGNAFNQGLFDNNSNFLGFATNGLDRGRITSTGQWAIGTTSGYAQLTIASTTASATFKPQLSLTDSSAGANSKHWTFASEGGNLYIGTSTDLQATSSLATLSILSNGYLGIASSTPWSRLSLGGSGIASSSITVAEYDYGAPNNIATSTAMTIDGRTANTQVIPIGTSATTITICNLAPGSQMNVRISNPNASAGAITWAVCSGYQLYWAGGTVPTQTTTANKSDLWSFKATSATSNATSTPATLIIGAQTANF